MNQFLGPLVAPVADDEQFDLEPCSPDENGGCSCPRRESVPSRPKFDPTLSTSELRKLIIRQYGASAFNRCMRQTLPLMQGEPLPIPTKNDMKPVAVHTPVAIPLHWEEKVYSGEPRRTVDLQALNRASDRLTTPGVPSCWPQLCHQEQLNLSLMSGIPFTWCP